MAPMSGARNATTKLAMPLASPRRNVLSVAEMSAFQYCLKNSGKNPAMTVVANDELAQSYIAQPNTGRRSSILSIRHIACSRVSRNVMSGQRSSVSSRFTREGAR